MSALKFIQQELKAPKNQKNSFGNYRYRSAEDILEAVKPLLDGMDCSLTLSDSIEMYGDRIYVKARATLSNERGTIASTEAYAREPAEKKGMDPSQITGTASSYARKYALNGLFCIDDTKDTDTMEYAKESKAKKEIVEAEEARNQPITKDQEEALYRGMADVKMSQDDVCKYMQIEKLSDLKRGQVKRVVELIEAKKNNADS